MKTVVAKNKEHLSNLINKEIINHGENCNLNFIDISNLSDISYLFYYSHFNGDISEWDTSNIIDMNGLFAHSKFNSDISGWNVSRVKNMEVMFFSSQFNGDIENWDVKQVKNMRDMFRGSKFKGNITKWQPYNLTESERMFGTCECVIPYWANFNTQQERKKAIDKYVAREQLKSSLGLELEKKDEIVAKRNKL